MEVRIIVETLGQDGEVKTQSIGALRRCPEQVGPEDLGLALDEAKGILARLQETVLQEQIDEIVRSRRVCSNCGNTAAIHDDRGCVLDTLFGRLRVKSPRVHRCRCNTSKAGSKNVWSPLADLFPDRATPQMQRLQAELGSRHSFREAARLIETFLPCAPQLNTTVRNRLADMADKLTFREIPQSAASSVSAPASVTVFLDGAHIRCRPEYQKRHLDVVVGKIETPTESRRFGLVQQAAQDPVADLRNGLIAQGWDGNSNVTVIADGDFSLPNLVRSATQGRVTYILDWWHVSMRIKHVENAVIGLLQADGFEGIPELFKRSADNLRWYLWHGCIQTAGSVLAALIIDCGRLGAASNEVKEATKRLGARCVYLLTYLSSNLRTLVDYGHRYRNGLAISSSRAEGCVDDIGNARMGKQRRMRWSPVGAHRVATTRAAVLDGRLTVQKLAA